MIRPGHNPAALSARLAPFIRSGGGGRSASGSRSFLREVARDHRLRSDAGERPGDARGSLRAGVHPIHVAPELR